MSETDALTEILNETQPPANPQEAGQNMADILKRLDDNEKAMAALRDENQQLKNRQDAVESQKVLTAAQLGHAYTGPTVNLIHPTLGHEVLVKESLVESFLEQGYKEPKAGRKK